MLTAIYFFVAMEYDGIQFSESRIAASIKGSFFSGQNWQNPEVQNPCFITAKAQKTKGHIREIQS